MSALKILDLFDSWILHKASLKSASFDGRQIEVSFVNDGESRHSAEDELQWPSRYQDNCSVSRWV
jgi:hypothetical protein